MVHFFIEDADLDTTSLTHVSSWLEFVAENHQHSIENLNYIFCSDHYLLKINQEHLSHDYFTDIITFDNRDDSSLPIEGDIFISVVRVKENAINFNTPFFDELLRVFVHGLLHLLGFSDSTHPEKIKMRKLEDQSVAHYYSQFHQSYL